VAACCAVDVWEEVQVTGPPPIPSAIEEAEEGDLLILVQVWKTSTSAVRMTAPTTHTVLTRVPPLLCPKAELTTDRPSANNPLRHLALCSGIGGVIEGVTAVCPGALTLAVDNDPLVMSRFCRRFPDAATVPRGL
jgi:hypothetical protein